MNKCCKETLKQVEEKLLKFIAEHWSDGESKEYCFYALKGKFIEEEIKNIQSPQETPSANKETIEDNSKSRICKCTHSKKTHVGEWDNDRCCACWKSKKTGDTMMCDCMKYEKKEA